MLKRLLLILLATPLLAGADTFSLTDINGRVHTPADHPGKWVLVNVWATWCPPCLAEMPELEALSKARPDLVVLGLAVDGKNPRRIGQFAEKLHISYPVIAGDEEMTKQFGVRGVPTSILYDPSGRQALLKEGPVTRQEIEAALQRGVR